MSWLCSKIPVRACQRYVSPIIFRSSSSASKEIDHAANWEKANQIFYSNERDTKNFPHPVQAETHPAVRLGFIPESYFKAFYDKTGVTGPYMFGTGAVLSMLSVEWIIVEHGFAEFLTFWTAFAILANKLGPGLGKYLDKMDVDFTTKRWDEPIARSKENAQAVIDELQTAIAQQEGQKLMFEAKRENVDLQLEAIYRNRLSAVYSQVKKRLDYQLATENAQKRYQQTHMVNWIVDNVMKGITPQQEKDSISKCIQELKGLSQKAATA
jgi:F-type H+-transporting ATPase subunit b